VVRRAKKGGGKHHISHSEVMATLKSISEHRASPLPAPAAPPAPPAPVVPDIREQETI
jgi:hypothetical protein